MEVTVVYCPIGLLALDENLNIVDYVLYPKDPRKAAESVYKLSEGNITAELNELLDRLVEKGYRKIVFEDEGLAKNVSRRFRVEGSFLGEGRIGNKVRRSLDQIAHEIGFLRKDESIEDWVREVSIELSKIKVRLAMEKRDALVIKTVQAIDDLEKTSNLLVNRLREWYGLHFPELDSLVKKNETYVRLVNLFGDRESFTVENLIEAGIPEEKAKRIARASAKSIGASLSVEDIERVRGFSNLISEIDKEKKRLERYLDDLMSEVSPNVKALVGSLLGAKLISRAGGLENLAKMPASTIQVLGAEKALFRSLRTGAKPPKHGVIFQHKFIREARRRQRGKIARTLAGKLAIAARIDAFGGSFIGEELRELVERRVKEIRGRR
ncbi:C/D box methylation guide ribonucleoprotein complex aNOP56 subunit [Candidatus Bathyarchaeota archaeon]|nr:C/D box methylation guide ribonucleoprotein complex aNOP56 subunit [Candidatus Bathyarchaeota archaeon]